MRCIDVSMYRCIGLLWNCIESQRERERERDFENIVEDFEILQGGLVLLC